MGASVVFVSFLLASAVFSGSASLPLRLCPTRYRRCLFGPIPACLGVVSVCLEDRFLPASASVLPVSADSCLSRICLCLFGGPVPASLGFFAGCQGPICFCLSRFPPPLHSSASRPVSVNPLCLLHPPAPLVPVDRLRLLRFLPPPQVCSVFSGSLRYRFSALHSCALRSACGRHPRPYLASGRRSAADRPLGYSRGDCGSVWSE